MAGAPTKFTQELFDDICDNIATSSIGLAKLCKDKSLNPSTFYDWLKADVELANKYAYARELQAELLADEIIEIADEDAGINPASGATDSGKVNQNRLRVDARKWIASKLLPKKYGDKLDVTSSGKKIGLDAITEKYE